MAQDIDHIETQEWMDALDSVLKNDGPERAHFILEQLASRAGSSTGSLQTDYINTILPHEQPAYPGNQLLEKRIQAYIRWNAIAMVVKANKKSSGIGGHLSSFTSICTLYEVGLNHFFKAPSKDHGGDLIFFQGHSSPGNYSRAYLEGRLTEEQLGNFRQECGGKGLSSYPHPWLMPDFWQFPTVSMGLGPIQAIYQARLLKYLHNRGIQDTAGRKVWCFIGDGETSEPETLGMLNIAKREGLDNLIFVVNCNLQRLDGLVYGNGKIIQELEGVFKGAGWQALKVIWGSDWDKLLAKDKDGLLVKRMNEALDGDYQAYKANDGAFVREHFFGKYPELKAMVADMSDAEIQALKRGAMDRDKIYAAYDKAVKTEGVPTAIITQSIKGFGLGQAGESQMVAHNTKKMAEDEILAFRDRFRLDISDEDAKALKFKRFAEDSEEYKYLIGRREALGGFLPARKHEVEKLELPPIEKYEAILKSSGDREISTTMAFVRFITTLMKDKGIGKRVVPIIPDECRTFGMEGMFRQFGIYSHHGQLYTPEDAKQLMYYREATDGQVLEEGLTEAGAMASWMAAATSYSNNGETLIPFYIYYSMFGFQRIGDMAWAAGDLRARGFMLGATAGRTTLNGEGLQHEDGHNHLFSATIPNCISYDPTYSYEVAVIFQEGMRRMYVEHEDVFYYMTLMNENYKHPEMPKGCEEGILKGMYLLRKSKSKAKKHVQLLGCGTILNCVVEAAEILEKDFDVAADVWSATSFTEMARDGISVERENLRKPSAKPKQAYITECLAKTKGPVIASTDYIRAFAEQVRPYVGDKTYKVLGTDGFGRSDSREALRDFFEVDAKHVAYTALAALKEDGEITLEDLKKAQKKLIDSKKAEPWTQ